MKSFQYLLTAFLFLLQVCIAQQTDTLIHKLASLNKQQDTGRVSNDINPAAYNKNTRISVSDYFILLGSDFKQQITAPFHLSGHDALKVGVFVGGMAVLSSLDEPVQQAAVHAKDNNTISQ
jgi:hypothetical protein